MNPIIMTGAFTNNVPVNNGNTDERGVLRNCQMLQEITNINDKAIMEIFGPLNFSGINVLRYHVFFHEAALRGDTLTISLAYTYSETSGLVIEIKVHKTKTRKNITVLTGDFTYINNPIQRTQRQNKKEAILLDFK